MVPKTADPTKFIGTVAVRENFHVKLVRVIANQTDGKTYWKIQTRDGKLGIIAEKDVTYAPMVDPVMIDDCFMMSATVQKHAMTENGEVQTFFRSAEITVNYGSLRKART